MLTPPEVHVCEVGPRDGLQNETVLVATSDKLRLIAGLAAAGLPEIEVTSFVRPDLIPQLADAEEVLRTALATLSTRVRALVPNLRGAERALQAGAPALLQVIGASETFNRKNVRRSVAESSSELHAVAAAARRGGATAMLSVSTCFGCPYEGDVPVEAVTRLVEAAGRAGMLRVEICDTIGVANPRQVYALCEQLRREFPDMRFELHFHDTRGLGLANVVAAIDAGIVEFAGSLGGMGGCPFAPGATGNVCTLDLVNMLNEMGVRTGVRVEPLIELGRWLEGVLGHRLPGHVLRAGVQPVVAKES
ncbi:MAG: hydroxymethylglutaryl-CoA lyase [Gemmatimonadetes bacterium]|nr:hydroxymethylglutaryl-CoA lyase [Gemmatimonadota bacterium]